MTGCNRCPLYFYFRPEAVKKGVFFSLRIMKLKCWNAIATLLQGYITRINRGRWINISQWEKTSFSNTFKQVQNNANTDGLAQARSKTFRQQVAFYPLFGGGPVPFRCAAAARQTFVFSRWEVPGPRGYPWKWEKIALVRDSESKHPIYNHSCRIEYGI